MNDQKKTYKELCLIARKKNIKYFAKYTKNQLEEMLGLEISNPNENYEKYCREKMKNPIPVIFINRETGEILNFNSLGSAAKSFNINVESIKFRIKKKKDLKINNQSFLVFYDC